MPRISPANFIVITVLLVVFITLINLGILRIAFDKLGLSASGASLMLMTSLFGSILNLPLFSMRADDSLAGPVPPLFRGLLHRQAEAFHGRTLVAVNVGGCLVPVAFSGYLLWASPLQLVDVVTAIAVVSTIAFLLSRPVPGLGIGMPIFVAPISAALVAVLLAPEQSAALAYISGTLGVLIGADLLKINVIRRLGTPIASIGGAGTFDGIFITGIVAVLLA